MFVGISLITTLLVLLAAAIGGGAIAARLKLPSIVGYIAGGVLIGNLMSRFINHDVVSLIADNGITLLLFALGIEFSFHKLRRILTVVAWPTIAQLLVSFILVLLLLVSFAVPFIAAIYLAAAAALSSTAIVVKVLSEKGELETVPGEIATGWLIVQDLAVIPILIILAAVSGVSGQTTNVVSTMLAVLLALVKSAVLISILLYLGRHGVPKLLSVVAGFKNRELLLLSTIGIVFFIGLCTYSMGLSVSLGAFLAGLLIAETSQNHAVFAEIRPLRDLFAVVFFVSLGLALPFGAMIASLPMIAVISLAVIIGKLSVVFILLRFLGYHRKTAFLAGLYLTQVSEFGFVLAHQGVASGAMTVNHGVILTAVTFVTILLSAPLISRGHAVYYVVNVWLSKFPRIFKVSKEEAMSDEGLQIFDHVVICGYGRVGKYIGRALQMANVGLVVVDYNQHTIRQVKEQGIQTVYGDPGDKGVLDYAQVDKARCIVIAIPDRHTQELIISNAQSLNRHIKIMCRTHHEEDRGHLKSLGVQTIIQPEFEAALTIVAKLLADFGLTDEEITGKMQRLKIEHGVG
ncbi:MAG: cation:proton antiporter [Patescibacteria group bacterium]